MPLRLSRRHLLLGAAAAPIGLAGWVLSAEPSQTLSFLAVGDWGVEGEAKQRDVAKQMGLAAERYKSSFVVSLGDNFYGSGVASTEDEQWQTSFERIYDAKSLQVPWHAILGNHDYHGNVDAQIDYSQKSSRWKMPARYYRQAATTSDQTTVDMFFLDTVDIEDNYTVHKESNDQEENRREREEAFAEVAQLPWLEENLAASKADWKLVFGHHPILSGGVHGPTKELVLTVKPMLERHAVAAYFNGHDHDLQHLFAPPLHYFCSGAGARTREVSSVEGTLFCSDRAGFVAVTMQSRRMQVDFIDYEGKTLHSATVERPA